MADVLFGLEVLGVMGLWDGRFQRDVNKPMLEFFQKVKQADTVIKAHLLHGLSVKLGNRVLQPVPERSTGFGKYYQSCSAVLGILYPDDMPIPFHSL